MLTLEKAHETAADACLRTCTDTVTRAVMGHRTAAKLARAVTNVLDPLAPWTW